MQTEKAKALNKFLNDVVYLFVSILEDRESEIENLSVSKVDLNEDKFTVMYSEFIEELKANMIEYRDLQMSFDYIKTCLFDFNEWNGFGMETNTYILQKGNEVNLLFKTKQQLDNIKTKIDNLLGDDHSFPQSNTLRRMFYEATEPECVVEEIKEPTPEDRFIFDKLMLEIDAKNTTTLETIGFINDRLFEFKKWQIANDTKYEYNIFGKVDKIINRYSSTHYPHFEQLCGLEIDKYQNRHKIEKAEITKKAIANNPVIIQQNEPSPYTWNANDIDLVELIAALHVSESIKRTDDKVLTRKELVDYFQKILNIDIKQPETKLTKAGNRDNNTPFLDMLAQEFRNFVADKDRKLAKRK